MYKLMAIDLDGTLLNSFGEVSQETREALKKAKEQGTEVVLSSGRPISSTESLAVELGVDNYLISGNGAVKKIAFFTMCILKKKLLQVHLIIMFCFTIKRMLKRLRKKELT